MRYFITQLLSRMKDIERKGTFFFGDDESPSAAFNQKKIQFMSKMNNSTANLSDRLRDMLFNKRDEGYYFRKFQREKNLEGQNNAKSETLNEKIVEEP